MSFLINVGRPGIPGGGAGPLWKPFIATSIKGLADVTRNSIGTATDASGNVVAFATDMPRQTSAGLLVEDGTTNKVYTGSVEPDALTPTTDTAFETAFPGMDAFDAGTGALFGATDQSAAVSSGGLQGFLPNGRVFEIDNRSGSGDALINLIGTVGNTNDHVSSVWLWSDTTPGAYDVGMGLNPASTKYLSSTISATPQRYEYSETPANAGRKLQVLVKPGHRIYFALPQLEEGSVATSYIPTVASAVTRIGENPSIPLTRIPGFDPSSDYSILVEFDDPPDDGNDRFAMNLYTDSSNRIGVYKNYAGAGNVAVFSVESGNFGSTYTQQQADGGSGTIRVAASIDISSGLSLSVDGATTVTDLFGSGFPTGVVGLALGCRGDVGANRLDTNLLRLIIVQSTLSPAQLEAWSTSGGDAPVAAVLDLDFTTPSHEMPGYAFEETVLDEDFTAYGSQDEAGKYTFGAGWSLDAANNQLDASSAADATNVRRVLEVNSGETYNVEVTVSNYSAGGLRVFVGGTEVITTISADGTYNGTVTVSSGSPNLDLRANGTTTLSIDNLTIKRAYPDLSPANNGAIINGTLAAAAVATGADLKKLTIPATSSDYIEVPTSDDLQIATGEFMVRAWVKTNDTANTSRVFERNSLSPSSADRIILLGSNGLWRGYVGSTPIDISQTAGEWAHLVLLRRGTTVEFWVNQELVGTLSNADDLTVTDPIARIGTAPTGTNAAIFDIALVQWTKGYAPSPEQIRKMHEDERPLFKDGP